MPPIFSPSWPALLLLCTCLAAGEAPPPGTAIAFPEDARHAEMKRDFGAKGDGVTDDTAAFKKAMGSIYDMHCRPIHVPPGTYLVSDTLRVRKPDGKPFFGTKFIGHSQQTTIIRLKDKAPGFGDPAKPKPVVHLCSRDQEHGGNMGHWNSIINLTIDTGSGNPGAVGVEYIASNEGSLRDLTVRSGDGAGVMGIDMTKPWPGPCLLSRVTVVGFDAGIATAHGLYSVTFKDITLRDQRVAGMQNSGNMLCMLGLTSRNTVPAIAGKGKLCLLNADLGGGSAGGPAIDHEGPMYLRNVRASGYAGVRRGAGDQVGEWVDSEPMSAFPSPQGSLNLPWEDTPDQPYEPPATWRNAGGTSESMQAAIDSGATTIYIPFAEHFPKETVIVRGNVRRIVGMYSLISSRNLGDKPFLRFENKHPVIVEFLQVKGGGFQAAGSGSLVVRQCNARMTNGPEAGPLFVEDNCSAKWQFDHPQRIFLYQFNPESPEFNLRVKGAHVFCLGFKSEREGVQVEVSDGGAVEILGGVIYPCNPVPTDRPMFAVNGGALSAFVTYFSFVKDGIHAVKLRETRGGETRDFKENIYGRLLCAYAERPALAQKRDLERRAADARRGEAAARTAAVREQRERTKAEAEAKRATLGPVIAEWDAKLQALVRTRTAAGRGPLFDLAAMRARATIVEADERGGLQLKLGSGGTISYQWKMLSDGERAQIATEVAAAQDTDSLCVAGFFLLLVGRDADARMRLAGAGEAGAAVAAIFAEPAPAQQASDASAAPASAGSEASTPSR